MTPLESDRGPVMDQAPAGYCPSCSSPFLRRSQTREGDGVWMLALQWPVRCMTCLKRTRIPLWKARRAIPLSVAHSGAFVAEGTWHDPADASHDADQSNAA